MTQERFLQQEGSQELTQSVEKSNIDNETIPNQRDSLVEEEEIHVSSSLPIISNSEEGFEQDEDELISTFHNLETNQLKKSFSKDSLERGKEYLKKGKNLNIDTLNPTEKIPFSVIVEEALIEISEVLVDSTLDCIIENLRQDFSDILDGRCQKLASNTIEAVVDQLRKEELNIDLTSRALVDITLKAIIENLELEVINKMEDDIEETSQQLVLDTLDFVAKNIMKENEDKIEIENIKYYKELARITVKTFEQIIERDFIFQVEEVSENMIFNILKDSADELGLEYLDEIVSQVKNMSENVVLNALTEAVEELNQEEFLEKEQEIENASEFLLTSVLEKVFDTLKKLVDENTIKSNDFRKENFDSVEFSSGVVVTEVINNILLNFELHLEEKQYKQKQICTLENDATEQIVQEIKQRESDPSILKNLEKKSNEKSLIKKSFHFRAIKNKNVVVLPKNSHDEKILIKEALKLPSKTTNKSLQNETIETKTPQISESFRFTLADIPVSETKSEKQLSPEKMFNIIAKKKNIESILPSQELLIDKFQVNETQVQNKLCIPNEESPKIKPQSNNFFLNQKSEETLESPKLKKIELEISHKKRSFNFRANKNTSRSQLRKKECHEKDAEENNLISDLLDSSEIIFLKKEKKEPLFTCESEEEIEKEEKEVPSSNEYLNQRLTRKPPAKKGFNFKINKGNNDTRKQETRSGTKDSVDIIYTLREEQSTLEATLNSETSSENQNRLKDTNNPFLQNNELMLGEADFNKTVEKQLNKRKSFNFRSNKRNIETLLSTKEFPEKQDTPEKIEATFEGSKHFVEMSPIKLHEDDKLPSSCLESLHLNGPSVTNIFENALSNQEQIKKESEKEGARKGFNFRTNKRKMNNILPKNDFSEQKTSEMLFEEIEPIVIENSSSHSNERQFLEKESLLSLDNESEKIRDEQERRPHMSRKLGSKKSFNFRANRNKIEIILKENVSVASVEEMSLSNLLESTVDTSLTQITQENIEERESIGSRDHILTNEEGKIQVRRKGFNFKNPKRLNIASKENGNTLSRLIQIEKKEFSEQIIQFKISEESSRKSEAQKKKGFNFKNSTKTNTE